MSAPSTSAHAYVVDAASYDAETQSRETNVYMFIQCHISSTLGAIQRFNDVIAHFRNSHVSHVAL